MLLESMRPNFFPYVEQDKGFWVLLIKFPDICAIIWFPILNLLDGTIAQQLVSYQPQYFNCLIDKHE